MKRVNSRGLAQANKYVLMAALRYCFLGNVVRQENTFLEIHLLL